MHDAVVIGSGPNGLVAANVLADHGWDVLVLEAAPDPGGAVRTAEVTAPGFRNDLFSAFYPLGAASPPLRSLDLERWGLRWVQAPLAAAHPTAEGPAAVLSTSLSETIASLDGFAPGDGDGWRRLYEVWQRAGDSLVQALLSPFPPVRGGLRLAARMRSPSRLLDFARLGVLSVRRLAAEHFHGEGGALLLTGMALHADITPESAGSGLLGWMMTSLGQDIGFPVPEGGAGELTAALVRRLESKGGHVLCNTRVDGVEVRGGRAVAVRSGDDAFDAARAVVADVSAPRLFTALVPPGAVPASFRARLDRFEHGFGTVKVDWALSSPIPWVDPACRRAGTLHIADSTDDLSDWAVQVISGRLPARPFLIVGQMTTSDPTRSPVGTESAWAYTHVPQLVRSDLGPDGITGRWDADETERYADRVEACIERYAPGFRERIVARHVFTPRSLEQHNANLVGGDVGGGTNQLHQQLVFRPVAGLGRAETPIRGLYLASASAHPGGGVHGACGANAARAALWHDRLQVGRSRRVP